MRLFGLLRKAENEIPKNVEEKRVVGGRSAGAVLIQELVEGGAFRFGEPWQLAFESLSAVVPIIRMEDRDRQYMVIQEIQKKSAVTDSGRIGKVGFRVNGVKQPVFVRAGTIFKGQGTQSRTSSMGVVLEPGKENLIDVFCIHSTHGISAFNELSTACDVVPRRVEDVLSSMSKNQSMVWEASAVAGVRADVTTCPSCHSSRFVQDYYAELVCLDCGLSVSSIPSGSTRQSGINSAGIAAHQRLSVMSDFSSRDNLVSNLEEMKKYNEKVEDVLSKIPADLNDQVGVAIIDSCGVLGLEMFDHPDSWRAFSRSIVRNYTDVLAKERGQIESPALTTERIQELIRKFLTKPEGLSETAVFKNRIGETRMFTGGLAGEYTTIGSNVIHLLLKRKIAT